MRKKDYERIAEAFSDYFRYLHEGRIDEPSVSSFGELLAERLAQVNPKFDRDKFLDACGIDCGHYTINLEGYCSWCGIKIK